MSVSIGTSLSSEWTAVQLQARAPGVTAVQPHRRPTSTIRQAKSPLVPFGTRGARLSTSTQLRLQVQRNPQPLTCGADSRALPELSYNLSEAQQAGRTVSDPHARDSGASFTLVDAWTLLKTLDLTQEAPAKQGARPVWPLAHRERHEAWVCSVTRFGGTVFPRTAWCVKPS